MDAKSLRDAFGAFLTGVTVVTTINENGEPVGFTANSFTSVSLDPPLLLVCLAKSSRNREVFATAKGFAVSILSESQEDVSNTFARPVEDRFARVDWQFGPCGSPVFADVAAWFDCVTQDVIDAGDHVMLLGRVEDFENGDRQGLGFSRGGYFTPTLDEKRLFANIRGGLILSMVAERDGGLLLVDDGEGGWSVPTIEKRADESLEELEGRVSSQLKLPVTLGLLYSVYEEDKAGRQHVVYRADVGYGTGAGGPHDGRFFPLQDVPLADIRDDAIRETVARYVQESEIGNFGIYFGNQKTGYVHNVGVERSKK